MRPGQDILNVVFVHGWKHSAAPKDGNIETFRAALQRLAKAEQAVSHAMDLPARRVGGVYVGWRGASITWPALEELTFWDRKNTAHEVGHGDVTELLSQQLAAQFIRTTGAPEATADVEGFGNRRCSRCRVSAGRPSRAEIFRVRGGKPAEHWDVISGPPDKVVNPNSRF